MNISRRNLLKASALAAVPTGTGNEKSEVQYVVRISDCEGEVWKLGKIHTFEDATKLLKLEAESLMDHDFVLEFNETEFTIWPKAEDCREYYDKVYEGWMVTIDEFLEEDIDY